MPTDELAQSNLHLILPPESRAQLAAKGIDPLTHTMITVPSARIQMADAIQPQGYMFLLTAYLPPDLLTMNKVLLAGGGRSPHPLDNALSLAPDIGLVVPIARLTQQTRAALEATVQAALVPPAGAAGGELVLPGEFANRPPVDPTLAEALAEQSDFSSSEAQILGVVRDDDGLNDLSVPVNFRRDDGGVKISIGDQSVVVDLDELLEICESLDFDSRSAHFRQ